MKNEVTITMHRKMSGTKGSEISDVNHKNKDFP